MTVYALFAGLFSGLLASMGLGGGSVLVLYLVLLCDFPQLKAGGTNLLFFIPIALISVVIYTIKKQIRFRDMIFIISGGVSGAVAGIFLAPYFGNDIIKKGFGIFICILGVKEIINTVNLYLKK